MFFFRDENYREKKTNARAKGKSRVEFYQAFFLGKFNSLIIWRRVGSRSFNSEGSKGSHLSNNKTIAFDFVPAVKCNEPIQLIKINSSELQPCAYVMQ